MNVNFSKIFLTTVLNASELASKLAEIGSETEKARLLKSTEANDEKNAIVTDSLTTTTKSDKALAADNRASNQAEEEEESTRSMVDISLRSVLQLQQFEEASDLDADEGSGVASRAGLGERDPFLLQNQTGKWRI
jgi:hypothetical protein